MMTNLAESPDTQRILVLMDVVLIQTARIRRMADELVHLATKGPGKDARPL